MPGVLAWKAAEQKLQLRIKKLKLLVVNSTVARNPYLESSRAKTAAENKQIEDVANLLEE